MLVTNSRSTVQAEKAAAAKQASNIHSHTPSTTVLCRVAIPLHCKVQQLLSLLRNTDEQQDQARAQIVAWLTAQGNFLDVGAVNANLDMSMHCAVKSASSNTMQASRTHSSHGNTAMLRLLAILERAKKHMMHDMDLCMHCALSQSVLCCVSDISCNIYITLQHIYYPAPSSDQC